MNTSSDGKTLVSWPNASGAITIPTSVEAIADSAFYHCENLTSISIPSSVTSIGTSAFNGCTSLASVTFAGSNPITFGISVFNGCYSLANITLPEGLTSIPDYTFYDCTALASVTFPTNLQIIKVAAFYHCESLTNLVIPNSVTVIEFSAFNNCWNLTNVTLPNSITSLESSLFAFCGKLDNIIIPNTVTSIANGVFYFGSSLQSIIIPSAVTSIADTAFYGCTSLDSITFRGNTVAADPTCFDFVKTAFVKVPPTWTGSAIIGGRRVVPDRQSAITDALASNSGSFTVNEVFNGSSTPTVYNFPDGPAVNGYVPIPSEGKTITITVNTTEMKNSVNGSTPVQNIAVSYTVAINGSVQISFVAIDSNGSIVSSNLHIPMTISRFPADARSEMLQSIYGTDEVTRVESYQGSAEASSQTANVYNFILTKSNFIALKTGNIPCFPTGVRILTPTGYRTVDTLRSGDLVQTADGRSVAITKYETTVPSVSTRTAPYLIPAHTFGHNSPPADLRLSPLHAFQIKKGVWQIPQFADNSKITQYGIGEAVTYYHLECPNFLRDNLVAEGCVVESFAGKQIPAGIKIYTPSRRLDGYTRITSIHKPNTKV